MADITRIGAFMHECSSRKDIDGLVFTIKSLEDDLALKKRLKEDPDVMLHLILVALLELCKFYDENKTVGPKEMLQLSNSALVLMKMLGVAERHDLLAVIMDLRLTAVLAGIEDVAALNEETFSVLLSESYTRPSNMCDKDYCSQWDHLSSMHQLLLTNIALFDSPREKRVYFASLNDIFCWQHVRDRLVMGLESLERRRFDVAPSTRQLLALLGDQGKEAQRPAAESAEDGSSTVIEEFSSPVEHPSPAVCSIESQSTDPLLAPPVAPAPLTPLPEEEGDETERETAVAQSTERFQSRVDAVLSPVQRLLHSERSPGGDSVSLLLRSPEAPPKPKPKKSKKRPRKSSTSGRRRSAKKRPRFDEPQEDSVHFNFTEDDEDDVEDISEPETVPGSAAKTTRRVLVGMLWGRPDLFSQPLSFSRKKKKPSASRRRWSQDEENAVIDGVVKFGEGSWKEIKSAYGHVLHPGRTVVNIKDKWRNLCKYEHVGKEVLDKLRK